MRVFISLILIPNLALILVYFFALECSYLCLCPLGLNLMLSMLHKLVCISFKDNIWAHPVSPSCVQGSHLLGEQTAVWDCDWGEVSGRRTSHCDNPCR